MKRNLVKALLPCLALLGSAAMSQANDYTPDNVSAVIELKTPGNPSQAHKLKLVPLSDNEFDYRLESDDKLPLSVCQKIRDTKDGQILTVFITAYRDVYFHYSQEVSTPLTHTESQFYMPGFWYRRNDRSPKGAPSFRVSDSWTVREDRLSAPLTGIIDEATGQYYTVSRLDRGGHDALTTHRAGEVILSGKTSVGYTGFANAGGKAALSFGFPYSESPKTYIRKLTLDPSVKAFQYLKRGESLSLTWQLREGKMADFSEFVQRTWEYSYDTYRPRPVRTPYSVEKMKNTLSRFFTSSLVTDKPLVFNSGAHLRVDDCLPSGVAEVGFIGRVLLNAFNAWEYGWQTGRDDLKQNSQKVFDSYLANGFTPAGFFKEYVDYRNNSEDPVHSIRRQSEGVYAMLLYLNYERREGRKHPEWEARIRSMLDTLMKLQHADGSFPRKFRDDFSEVDASGGSTPSATLPLVLGYKYFKEKKYLESAKRTVDYVESEIISKADYFSSTLDANCEDKEAALAAATATYYLSLATKGKESEHYAELCRKAAYFGLSWYYVWDVPFARGQMLGDIGLKTRGWGNVSVENNHIDVFVFDFADVLRWLSKRFEEPRFEAFAKVISTSMRQLLPVEGHMCGVGKPGFYPEVVQHTNWDYGRNGKGYYNDIFAPGWTVASLWELLTPGRAEDFLLQK